MKGLKYRIKLLSYYYQDISKMHDYSGRVSRKSKSDIMTGLFKVGEFTDMLLN